MYVSVPRPGRSDVSQKMLTRRRSLSCSQVIDTRRRSESDHLTDLFFGLILLKVWIPEGGKQTNKLKQLNNLICSLFYDGALELFISILALTIPPTPPQHDHHTTTRMTLHQFNLSRVHGASITLCTDTVKPALTSRALPAVKETLAWTIKLLHCFKTKRYT